MNCSKIQEGVSSLIDNELRDDESQPVFAHLSECDACRDFLRDVIRLRSILSSAEPVPVPPTLHERVQSLSTRADSPTRDNEGRFLSWWRHRLAIPVPAAALTLAVILLTTAFSVAMLYNPDVLGQQRTPRVVYVIGMQPIEVQGASVSPIHEIH